ncbi:MAG: YbhB/YbcL family Raf kinase inhibitor-like protein [Armatimonadota bacterium]|nr:YbhB/YbcL family Raf kinase inhibitor-like protein [Armatimonadota bacterium]
MRASRVLHVLAALAGMVLISATGCERPPEGEPVQEPPAEAVGGAEPAEPTPDVTPEEVPEEMALSITSSAFSDGETIPVKYTADGEDVSPPLSFEGVPEDAAELALICHDPDAPRAGGWTHWVVYGMAPDIGGLPEAVPTTPTVDEPKLVQGSNSWPKTGYGGPAPPAGPAHRYQFTVYALSEELDLEPGATKDELEAAMEGTIIAEAMLEGLYGRG